MSVCHHDVHNCEGNVQKTTKTDMTIFFSQTLRSSLPQDHGRLQVHMWTIILNFQKFLPQRLKLHGHHVLASTPHFVSILSLRVRFSQIHLRSRSHPARRQKRPRFLCRACCRLSAATALLLLFHYAAGALILLHCSCFTVHSLHWTATAAIGCPTSYMCAPPTFLLRPGFPALVGHPAGRSFPSRPSHVSREVDAPRTSSLLPLLPSVVVPYY